MEYFEYKYHKLKENNPVQNYMDFVTSNTTYKHYLFDLSLLRYDEKVPKEHRDKASSILKRQKIMCCLPYAFVVPVFVFNYSRGYFNVTPYQREFKFAFSLFTVVCFFRIFQLGMLKYEATPILRDVSLNNLHSI